MESQPVFATMEAQPVVGEVATVAAVAGVVPEVAPEQVVVATPADQVVVATPADQVVVADPAPAGAGIEYPPTDPMEPDEALATAEREGLILLRADNKAGYQGVAYVAGKARAYQAIVRRRGETVRLGRFFTPEEAALCRARTPEGKAALDKAEAK